MSFLRKLRETNENNKIIFKNTISAFIIKGGALFISLFTMPAFMRYFDNQKILGVWFTVLSVLIWILSFDLGIGNGLRNKLVKAIMDNNKLDIKKYISSAYFIIGIFVIVIGFVGYIVSPFINWNAIFNISEELISINTMLIVIRCIFTGILLQFFLRLISSILYSLQKSAINNLLALVTSVLQLIFVLLAPSYSPEKNLIMLSFFYIIFSNLPLLIVTIIVFTTKLKDCFPRIRYFHKTYAMSVVKLGGLFFWCQILYTIIVNTNDFFITQYTSPEFVVEYQIYNKLFSLPGMLIMLTLTPIWSAVTKSIVENNFNWLAKLYKTLKKVALLAVIAEFLIIPFLQIIINLWLGSKAIQINYLYALSFAIFGGTFIYQSVFSTVVCGTGNMKLQSVCYSIGVIFTLIFIHYGMQIFNTWIIVVISNAIILIPYCILQQISLNRFIKFNMVERGNIHVQK